MLRSSRMENSQFGQGCDWKNQQGTGCIPLGTLQGCCSRRCLGGKGQEQSSGEDRNIPVDKDAGGNLQCLIEEGKKWILIRQYSCLGCLVRSSAATYQFSKIFHCLEAWILIKGQLVKKFGSDLLSRGLESVVAMAPSSYRALIIRCMQTSDAEIWTWIDQITKSNSLSKANGLALIPHQWLDWIWAQSSLLFLPQMGLTIWMKSVQEIFGSLNWIDDSVPINICFALNHVDQINHADQIKPDSQCDWQSC